MKNKLITPIFRNIFFCALFLSLLSCNDYLDITPPSQVSDASYLYTESQLQAYVNKYYVTPNAYNWTDNTYGGCLPAHYGSGGESPYANDLGYDDAIGRSGNNRFIKNSWTVSSKEGYWNFKNIRAINYFLSTVVPRYQQKAITGTDANIRHYIGEAYVLRAHEYFFRLMTLGDFPIVTSVLGDDQQSLVEASKRAPRDSVARFILSDLDKAIGLLQETPPSGITGQRITKNVALLLKSRVALFEGTWEKYFAGTAYVPNGTGWPGASKDYNKNYSYNATESCDYFFTQAMAAAAQVADAVNLTANSFVERGESSTAQNPYYDMFSSQNPSVYPEVLLWRQYNNLVSHSYNHWVQGGGNRGYTKQMEKTFLMQNGLPYYAGGSGYAGDDSIGGTKINRDWRWKLFMKAPLDAQWLDNIGTPTYWPKAPNIYGTDTKLSTSTGYILGKGYSQDAEMSNLGKDYTAFVVFRAAEAYLNYIEACYEKKGSLDAKADLYWKTLRKRAGVDANYANTIAATDMDIEKLNDWGAWSNGTVVDATLYNIRRERRCEFIGEGFRMRDLLRWKALDQLKEGNILAGFQLEGCKIWAMYNMFNYTKSTGVIGNYLDENVGNTISAKSVSSYQRVLQAISGTTNQYYNGYTFYTAHYLDPIAISHFLKTASDGVTIGTSPIYQNPGWPTVAGTSPDYSYEGY